MRALLFYTAKLEIEIKTISFISENHFYNYKTHMDNKLSKNY